VSRTGGRGNDTFSFFPLPIFQTARKILREANPAEWRDEQCGGGCGDSFSPKTPFPRHSRRRYDLLQIFGKKSSSFLIKGAPNEKSRRSQSERPFV